MTPEKPKHCSVCGRGPTEARGLCKSHYQKWRAGAPYVAPLMRTQKNLYSHCTIEGCTGKHQAKGLCARHYQRLWAGIPLDRGEDRGFPLGAAHPNAKLTADQVRQIRALHREGASYNDLVEMFGVHYDTIRGVIIRRTWRHI